MADEKPSEHPLFLELPLSVARVYDEAGGVDWVEAMPLVLATYPQITRDDYWRLSVAEALALLKKAPDG